MTVIVLKDEPLYEFVKELISIAPKVVYSRELEQGLVLADTKKELEDGILELTRRTLPKE
jgi:hypothetical protein